MSFTSPVSIRYCYANNTEHKNWTENSHQRGSHGARHLWVWMCLIVGKNKFKLMIPWGKWKNQADYTCTPAQETNTSFMPPWMQHSTPRKIKVVLPITTPHPQKYRYGNTGADSKATPPILSQLQGKVRKNQPPAEKIVPIRNDNIWDFTSYSDAEGVNNKVRVNVIKYNKKKISTIDPQSKILIWH